MDPVPEVSVSVTLPPGQNIVGPLAEITGIGEGFTDTVVVPVPGQTPGPYPVTVYVLVVPGVEVTPAPVVTDSPVAGDHIYIGALPAPDAVSAILPPGPHTPGVAGDIVIVGFVQVALR